MFPYHVPPLFLYFLFSPIAGNMYHRNLRSSLQITAAIAKRKRHTICSPGSTTRYCIFFTRQRVRGSPLTNDGHRFDKTNLVGSHTYTWIMTSKYLVVLRLKPPPAHISQVRRICNRP